MCILNHVSLQSHKTFKSPVMTSSSHLISLSRRLDVLTESYKQTLQSIHRIPRTPDPDDLADLTASIRDSLNSLSLDLELLTLSIDDLGGASRADSEESRQKLRFSVQAQRLGEDLKNARQTFRRTQIAVKKAEESARRKERDERLRQLGEPPPPPQKDTPTSSQTPPSQQTTRRTKRTDKLTEDDLLVNASGDVLAALRQTHALMASEVERSHFAAEILSNSTRELESLQESYTDLDAMLKTSKGLVTQLMKSNKSDTWYLMSARTFLMVVAAWLVWRRLLWGPTWWLVWLPLKILYMTMSVIVRPFGVGRGVEVGDPAVSLSERGSSIVMPSASKSAEANHAANIYVGQDPGSDPSKDGSLSQKIGRMVEQAEKVVRGDGAELEDSDEPRNPKKRVMDTSREGMNAGDVIEGLEQDENWQDAQEYVGEEQVRDEL